MPLRAKVVALMMVWVTIVLSVLAVGPMMARIVVVTLGIAGTIAIVRVCGRTE